MTTGIIMPHRNLANRPMIWAAILLFLLITLSGCSKQELYANQCEEHANEMIAILSQNGIASDKQPGEEGKWTITVSQGDFSKSVDILRSRGLPREQFTSVGELFKAGGMTDSPLAQRARLIYGTEEELRRMISEYDGVVSARVKLAMPEPDPLNQEVKPTSASVIVKYRTGFDLRSQTGAIKSLVANAVEGLSYDNVSVVIVPAQQLPVTKKSNDSIDLATLMQIIMAIIAFGIIGLAIRAMVRRKKRSGTAIIMDETLP